MVAALALQFHIFLLQYHHLTMLFHLHMLARNYRHRKARDLFEKN